MDNKEYDLIDSIMLYEGGDMTDAEVINLFQRLIDNEMAWSLQGSYGRMATRLIDAGLCYHKQEVIR